MNEVEEKRRRLGRLLRVTARSPYLKFLAREADVPEPVAQKILASTAEQLDPEGAKEPLSPPVSGRQPNVSYSKPKAAGPSTISGQAHQAPPSRMIINTDGASRGNPGLAGAGAYITLPDGTVIGAYKKFLGEATNNYAEYSALILGLDAAAAAGAMELEVRSDSELMVRQLTGRYKVKHPDIKQLVDIVRMKETKFARVFYRHIPREQNMIADRLSNEAIDEAT